MEATWKILSGGEDAAGYCVSCALQPKQHSKLKQFISLLLFVDSGGGVDVINLMMLRAKVSLAKLSYVY